MNARLRPIILLGGLLPLAAQTPPGPLGLGIFLAQAQGGEKDLYRAGGALEISRLFRRGSPVAGRLRAEVFALAPGSWKGRFGIPADAHSQGLAVGWDFLFGPDRRAVIPFLGVGGCAFRYTYRHVPDSVTMIDPSNPPLRTDAETTVAISASAGLIVPLGTALEGELRYTLLKHPGAALFGPVGEAFLGSSFNPAPSHFTLGLRWRF